MIEWPPSAWPVNWPSGSPTAAAPWVAGVLGREITWQWGSRRVSWESWTTFISACSPDEQCSPCILPWDTTYNTTMLSFGWEKPQHWPWHLWCVIISRCVKELVVVQIPPIGCYGIGHLDYPQKAPVLKDWTPVMVLWGAVGTYKKWRLEGGLPIAMPPWSETLRAPSVLFSLISRLWGEGLGMCCLHKKLPHHRPKTVNIMNQN